MPVSNSRKQSAMKVVGRIVARGAVVGLFLPMGDRDRLDGIYNVVEIMGALQIQRVGEPHMPRGCFTGLNTEGLLAGRPSSVMTTKELIDAGQIQETP